MKDFEISNNLSFCLNLIRAFAAQAVCLGHILVNWDHPDMGLQFLGVVLFFIISGFLISATI